MIFSHILTVMLYKPSNLAGRSGDDREELLSAANFARNASCM